METEERILELLSRLKPITLEQMSGIRLMNRTDTKFVTSKENLVRLLAMAQGKYYAQCIDGSMVPLNNVAAINTPDARTIAIKPWDKSMFRIIEKAIMDSDLGITPDNNGEIIRLAIPPLTEERRKQLAKQCGKEEEQAKISVRNARRDTIDRLKKAIKDGLAEDAEKDGEAKLQKVHDKYIRMIDELLALTTQDGKRYTHIVGEIPVPLEVGRALRWKILQAPTYGN